MKALQKTLLTAAIATLMPLAAQANPSYSSDRLIALTFDQTYVPTVQCAPLYVCDIALDAGETVLNIALGDTVRWVLSPAAGGAQGGTPHIFIKPTQSGLMTNVVITTTKHTYNIALRSRNDRPMLRVAFSFPDEIAAARAQAQQALAAQTAAKTEGPHDYRYRVSGSRELYPRHIYNDGAHTYIEYTENLPHIPALLAVGPNGDEVVNYRMKDRYTYMIDGVPDRMALVVGSGRAQERVNIQRGA